MRARFSEPLEPPNLRAPACLRCPVELMRGIAAYLRCPFALMPLPLFLSRRPHYAIDVLSHLGTPRRVPAKSRPPHPVTRRQTHGAYPRSTTAGSVREPT
jgi:hypothetical protein